MLDLSDNLIEYLPEEIGFLSKLETLYLRNNPIKNLPMSIQNLKNLSYLDLSQNTTISKDEKGKIKAWLPSTEVIF